MSLFDEDFPPEEQLPRTFRVRFEPIIHWDRPAVRIVMDGNQLGDPLTDHAPCDDGYRYHDVFHFANAAIMGWSPLVRQFLNRLRRSRPMIQVNEDGGRARVLEETLVTLIHDYGRCRNFSVLEAEEIEPEFINMLRRITADREIGRWKPAQWKKLVAESLDCFWTMRANGGGTLVGDLKTRNIWCERL